MRGILDVQDTFVAAGHGLDVVRGCRGNPRLARVRPAAGQGQGQTLEGLGAEIGLQVVGIGAAIRQTAQQVQADRTRGHIVIDDHLLGELRAEVIQAQVSRGRAADIPGGVAAEGPGILERVVHEIALDLLPRRKDAEVVQDRQAVAQSAAAVGPQHPALRGRPFEGQAGRESEARSVEPVTPQAQDGAESGFIRGMESIFPESAHIA